MQCHDIEQLLTSWLLGDLSETEAAEVKEHVEQCDGCRAAMRDIEPTLDLLRTALAAPSSAPERLSPAHRHRIENYGIQSETTRTRPRVIQWITVSHPQYAYAAALLLVGFFVVSALLMPAVSTSKGRASSIPQMVGKRELLKGRTETLEDYLIAGAVSDGAPDQSYGVQIEQIAELGEPPTPRHETVSLFSRAPTDEETRRQPDVVTFSYADTDDDGLADEPNGRIALTTVNGSGLVNAQNVTGADGVERWYSAAGDAVQWESGVAGDKVDLYYSIGEGEKPEKTKRYGYPVKPPSSAWRRALHGVAEALGGDEDNERALPPETSPPSDFSPQPVEFDSIAVTKSPVIMRGIYGSRSPSARGSAMDNYQWDEEGDEELVAPEVATTEEVSLGAKVNSLNFGSTYSGADSPLPEADPGRTLFAPGRPALEKESAALDRSISEETDKRKSALTRLRERRTASESDSDGDGLNTTYTLSAGEHALQKGKDDDAKEKKDLGEIVIPEIDFRGANINDVVAFLNEASVEFGLGDSDAAGAGGEKETSVDSGGFIALESRSEVNGNVPLLGDAPTTGRLFRPDEEDKPGAGSGPGVDPFAAEDDVTDNRDTPPSDHPLITFSARDITLDEATRIVADISNIRLVRENGKLVLKPRDAPEGELVHRQYSGMNGDAIELLTGKNVNEITEDEFKANLSAGASEVGWPSGSSVKYIAGENMLVVANTLENSDLLGKKIQQVKEESQRRAAETEESKQEEEQQTGPRFKACGVNPFLTTADQSFSTFSIDVDTAAYTLARNYMRRGYLPPAESVRTEEFVNFFDYQYPAPDAGTFKIYATAAPSPFGRGLQMLKIGVKGRRLGREEQRPAVLTFLIDTSGSMNQPDRLGLVKKSLHLLVGQLAPQDRVAIVQYDSRARLVLEHTPASQKEAIEAAIDSLQCGGSTNLEEGMRRAYELAARSFLSGAENRVLLLSDGVANLGTLAAEDILTGVADYRKQGITCSVFGFGIGTYDDTMLEALANKGDGAYVFIDSEEEARRVFVDDLAATLNTIATDVKIQVEFNQHRVARYRQLGYENRQLKKEDFRNDAVDAGEVGSGQSVTALYELELKGPDRAPPLAVVRLRFRRKDTGVVEEIERAITEKDLAQSFETADARFRLATCAAEFAEILRGSPFAAGSEFEDVATRLRPVLLDLPLDHDVRDLLHLIQSAPGMSRGEL